MSDLAMNDISHALEVLACDIELRPADAPAAGKIGQAARSAARRDGALVVTFDASAAGDVERFAAAERSCCATLAWEVRSVSDGVELTVRGSPEQLDLLSRVFASGISR